VRREVLRLAVYLPSCRTVADAFNAIHRGRAQVGKSWVHEQLRDHADEIAARRRAMRRRPPHAVPARQRWSLDLCQIKAGRAQRTVLGVIDQGSRAVLRLQVLARKCTWTLLGQLCLAIAEHGCPQAVRTDNEAMFTSPLWRTALAWAGIHHERIPPRSPWRNGRIERLFGTLKPLLRQIVLPAAAALQTALDEFAGFYNHVRVHQALAGLTPAQAWQGMSLADVRRARQGRWVLALGGLLVGYELRC
jgi:transposase InsO family protein